MTRIAKNTLTGWAVAFIALYLIAGAVLPPIWFAVTVHGALLIGGISAWWKWGPTAVRLLLNRESPDEIKGDVLSLLGIAALSTGSVYSGGFGIAWIAFGSPESWLNTPTSSFGRALMALGFYLLFKSAYVAKETLRPVNWWAFGALALAISVGSFFLGTKWRESRLPDASIHFSELRPRCGPDRPVWGNITSRGARIYHGPDSPYRSMVTPEQCFRTEAEARAAGFRAPG